MIFPEDTMKKDTLEKFAALLAALSAEREADGSFPRTIAPDVADQVKDIESLYYGLLDRMAFYHVDKDGNAIYLKNRTAAAYRKAVAAVRANEGDTGNSPDKWYNVLTNNPAGTLDGVLNIEKSIQKKVCKNRPNAEPT